MSKLDELRKMVATMFEKATEKEEIEKSVQLNSKIDEIEVEEKELVSKNAELISSYKELVKHTSFKGEPKDEIQPQVKEAPSLEGYLKEFTAKNKDI